MAAPGRRMVESTPMSVKDCETTSLPHPGEAVPGAMGELTNLLAGRIQAGLSEEGSNAEISLPSVIHGVPDALPDAPGGAYEACFDSPFGKLWSGVIRA